MLNFKIIPSKLKYHQNSLTLSRKLNMLIRLVVKKHLVQSMTLEKEKFKNADLIEFE